MLLFGFAARVAALPIPAIREYSTVVDVVNQKVTFNVLFDSPPDFSTVLGPNEFPQVLQFDVDPEGTLPGSGVGQQGFTFGPQFRALACDALAATCQNGTYTVYDRDNTVIGGIGAVRFEVTGNLFSMTVPFALLNETDGFFTYAIEDGAPGAIIRQVLFGTSSQHYSAPFLPAPTEVPAVSSPLAPSALVLISALAAMIAWSVNRRGPPIDFARETRPTRRADSER